MNSESVDFIYLDPPFNSNRTYEAPIGSLAAGAAFKDAWTLDDLDLAWHGEIAEQNPALYVIIEGAGLAHSKGMQAYLIMMAVRLLEMKRVLKPTGSLFLHCDPTAGHYLKMLLDTIFGKDNFRNEIVWCYTGPGSPKMRQFNRKHDLVYWYSNSADQWTFNRDEVRIPHKGGKPHVGGFGMDADMVAEYGRKGKVPETWWKIAIAPRSKSEYMNYPTQKPIALLERLLKAASKPGDVVLDPFCGCATTCDAAERLERQWIGIDLSSKAVELVNTRLLRFYDRPLLPFKIIHRKDIPMRTDIGDIPHYKTHKHTLFGKQEGGCACGHRFPFQNFTIDHIIPQDDGGTGHIENLQLLCNACNSLKGNRPQAYLLAELNKRGRMVNN